MDPRVGQTRPGRLGEGPPPTTAGGGGAASAPAGDPRAFIEQEVKTHKAVVFSKQICPSSRKAKEIMGSHAGPGGFEVVELDQRPDGPALQDTLESMTGKRTVPIIFLGGSFVGGADDLSALEASGQLDARLRG